MSGLITDQQDHHIILCIIYYFACMLFLFPTACLSGRKSKKISQVLWYMKKKRKEKNISITWNEALLASWKLPWLLCNHSIHGKSCHSPAKLISHNNLKSRPDSCACVCVCVSIERKWKCLTVHPSIWTLCLPGYTLASTWAIVLTNNLQYIK